MPGQRLPKVAAALIAIAAMGVTPAEADNAAGQADTFIEILALTGDGGDESNGASGNAGCNED